MCGFLVLIQPFEMVSAAAAWRAADSLVHRGPDAAGYWQEGDVFLGHRRLSIIDLAGGAQPMASGDGRYRVVFNGEIYNYRELRAELERAGAAFRTRSDTEVLLEGYRQWGEGLVDRLNGMFAFVLWDLRERTAFAARDRLGIKPLCWAVRRGSLVAASTLEPFGRLGGFDTLDLRAVRDLMAFDYIPSPRTIFEGVHKLEPGCRFSWKPGMREPAIDRYWSPPAAPNAAEPPDELEVEALLEKAVARQMVSDVPIGVFLSGGIDSSLLVAFMARHSAHRVRTFSVAFADAAADESAIAARVAQEFGTEHTELRAESVGHEELLDLIGRLDEPFCDAAFVPTVTLSQQTRKHVKVALSGDGGDEVFGGYTKYLAARAAAAPVPLAALIRRSLAATAWRPRGGGRLYARTLGPRERLRFAWACYGDFPVFRKDMRQLLAKQLHERAEVEGFFSAWERRAERYGGSTEPDALMRTDLETYLSENCLVKTDRASMLASLEVRVPYLDEAVLERILPLPASNKLAGGQLKALLLPIARRLLPREVWDRPKHGFNVPIDERLAGAWRPAVEAALDWGEANLEVFNYPYLRRLAAINRAERGIAGELWNPFVFLAWSMARRQTWRAAEPSREIHTAAS